MHTRISHYPLAILIAVAVATSVAADALRPGFAVRDGSGAFHQYDPSGDAARSTFDDDRLGATLSRVENDVWELSVRCKTGTLAEIWFPWFRQPLRDDAQARNDTFYCPTGIGQAKPAAKTRDFGWEGQPYPGGCVSPLVILADDREALLVAAANWPPQPVTPLFSRGRITLRFDDKLAAGQSATHRAIIARISGNASAGRVPWLLAADRYKSWLREHLTAAGLRPVRYPDWLTGVHGWLHIPLQDMTRFDAAQVRRRAESFGRRLGWVQFWGQMSNYAGPAHLASPPIRAGEECGCCVDRPGLHPRYQRELPPLVQALRSAGMRVGFYARPGEKARTLALTSSRGPSNADTSAMLDRVRETKEAFGADAFYIDVIGNWNFGPPLDVALLIRDGLPPDTVIEYGLDLYPAAQLRSADLTLEHAFPRLNRYLLDDVIIFMGESNGGYKTWGRKHAYRTEREAFLLGAKLDAIHPDEDFGPRWNPVVQQIIGLRDESRWWSRGLVYRDVLEIERVPTGIDVRRFDGNDGATAFAIDNPSRRTGQSFRFRGRDVEIPAETLSIMLAGN